MKKLLFALMLVLISVMAFRNPVFSQESTNDIAYNTKRPVLLSTEVETTSINTKALRDLHKYFAVNGEVKWYKRQEGYMAIFMMDGAKYRVDYNSKGRWSGTLRNYTEDKLDRDIRSIIKSVYFDYSIKWVWEISVPVLPGGPVYIVHVEDEKSFKNIEVHNGEMKVLEHYEK